MADSTIVIGSKDGEFHYPQNRGDDFICRLIKPLEFKEPHAVALQAIVYTPIKPPRTFFGDKGSDTIEIEIVKTGTISVKFYRREEEPTALLAYFNTLMKVEKLDFELLFETNKDGSVIVKVVNKLTEPVTIDEKFCSALGFNINVFNKKEHVAEHVVNTKALLAIPNTQELFFTSPEPNEMKKIQVKEPGVYNWEGLTKSLNSALKPYDIAVSMSPKTGMQIVSTTDRFLILGDKLQEILKADGTLDLVADAPLTFPVHIHQEHSKKLMVVHCNAVAPYQFGRHYWPVLKLIHPADGGAQIMERFESLEWYSCAESRFEEIRVKMTDELGHAYGFEGYPVSLILRFRKV